MSTKIYTGFISKGPIVGAKELFDASKGIQSALRTKSEELWYSEAGGFLARTYDRQLAASSEKTPYRQLSDYLDEVRKELAKGHRSPLFDTDISWVLFPRDDGRVMGMMFADQYKLNEYWERIRGSLGWEDYAYWDNSDEPEDVDYEVFKQRGKDWDDMIGYDAPSSRGFTMELWPKYGGPNLYREDGLDKALAHQPNLEERLKSATSFYLEKRAGEYGFKSDKKGMDIYYDYRDWRETDSGKEAYKKVEDELRTKLVPTVTKDMVLGKENT